MVIDTFVITNYIHDCILLQQEFSKREVRESTYVVRDSSYSSVEEKQQQQQSFLSNRPPRVPAGGARTETDAAHARFRYDNHWSSFHPILSLLEGGLLLSLVSLVPLLNYPFAFLPYIRTIRQSRSVKIELDSLKVIE